ncbi:MAG: GNAT family N-acetyltransferase [Chloroflexi bacterium]|nr:GNAT family N-acetyltransferase [Chloroflexota bacterium]
MTIPNVSDQDSAMEMRSIFPIDDDYFGSVNAHRRMLLDKERIQVYAQAIRDILRPGDIVADIGTGTGVLALFCVQAGADHVYAIERLGIINLAAQIAEDSGFKDNITFIQGDSRSTCLPRRVDLIVSETIGHFGPEEDVLPTLIDARDRFLRPGGMIIPTSLSLYLAPVELPYAHWGLMFDMDEYGLDFAAARRAAVNSVYLVRVDQDVLLAKPEEISSITFMTQKDVTISGKAIFRIAKRGTVHGLCGWHTIRLAENTTLSNCPGYKLPSSWRQCFFPILQPIAVSRGDRLHIAFEASSDTAIGQYWRWEVVIEGAGACFQQDSRKGNPACFQPILRKPTCRAKLNTSIQPLELSKKDPDMGICIVTLNDYDPSLLSPIIEADNDAFGKPTFSPWTLEAVMRFGKVFVGYEGEELVAVGEFIRDWNDPKNVYVVGLSVKPKKQNRGYGTLLLKSALEQLKEEGFSSVVLHVAESNPRALHIYNKLGFQDIGLRKNEYGDGEDRILMRKVLED